MGVIDGHDVARAAPARCARRFEAERPVVVHVATVKGKGFAPAEEGGLEGMEKWHAAKPKSIAERHAGAGRAPSRGAKPAPPQYTQVFGEALVRECERDARVVGITAAMNSGTGLSILQKALPERYFDVGIAEQQAVLFAAGLALQGVEPVCAIYSTFLQRAYDQIVHDVCLQNLPVTFAMDRAGLVGDDGPTHHGVFDIAYLRCLPNIVLMAPRDEAMLVHMLHTALATTTARSRCATRAARASASSCPPQPQPIEIGTGEILREGERVAHRRLRHRRRQGARRRRPARRARARGDRRRRALRQAARRRAAGPARRRARPARHRRGGRAGRRLRHRRVGGALRGRRRRRAILRVGLPDRYVTHGAPALLHEEVGFTGRADRRAHRGRRAGSARLARLRVVPGAVARRAPEAVSVTQLARRRPPPAMHRTRPAHRVAGQRASARRPQAASDRDQS